MTRDADLQQVLHYTLHHDTLHNQMPLSYPLLVSQFQGFAILFSHFHLPFKIILLIFFERLSQVSRNGIKVLNHQVF